jgi:hypothetical protein
MKRTLEMDISIQNGQGVIIFPADVPDGRVHLTITLTTRPDPASAAPEDNQKDAAQLLQQWHRQGLSKNEMVKRLGGDLGIAWRLVNEFTAGR